MLVVLAHMQQMNLTVTLQQRHMENSVISRATSWEFDVLSLELIVLNDQKTTTC